MNISWACITLSSQWQNTLPQHLSTYCLKPKVEVASQKLGQHELALEELFFFGKPYSAQSTQFSVSLGTNSTDSNSLSRRQGFLGLSPFGSAGVGEFPPHLQTWITEPFQRMRVERNFHSSQMHWKQPRQSSGSDRISLTV